MTRTLNRRPSHPGILLQSEMDRFGLTQGKVARLVHVGRRTINEICQGRRQLSADMAHRLGKLFGNGPELWMNMQRAVDLWDAKQAHRGEYAKIRTLRRKPRRAR